VIVRFGVTARSIDMPDLTMSEQLAVHARILETWREVGVLALPRLAASSDGITQAVRSLPQHARKLWQEALKTQRQCAVDSIENLERANTIDELSSLRGVLDLGCVGQAAWVRLCQRQEQISALAGPSGPEVCSFRLADQAEAFKRGHAQAREPIEADADVRAVWNTRFAEHVPFSGGHVTVVDRYALSSHTLRRDGKSGLAFVLNALARAGVRAVTLFSAVNGSRDRRPLTDLELIRGATDGVNRVGQQPFTVQLFLGHDHDFARFQHARYVRFGQTVCRLDTGLAVFNGDRVFARCEFAVEPISERAISDETRLRTLCRRLVVTTTDIP
jgi:hypothetical protein